MNNSEIIALQNLEYEESLRNDRKKEENKLIEIEKREIIEENILLKKENLIFSKNGELVKIKFQLPDKNITRVFTSNDFLSNLYDFIYIQDLGENFKIFTSHPKKLVNNDNSTLQESNISDRSKLYVYFNDL